MCFAEMYVIAFMVTLAVEKIREVLVSDPPTLPLKFRLWVSNIWNAMDCVGVLSFFLALAFRVVSDWRAVGRVLYAINVSLWTIRSLKFFSVNKYLGPFVTLMGKMVSFWRKKLQVKAKIYATGSKVTRLKRK